MRNWNKIGDRVFIPDFEIYNTYEELKQKIG